MRVVTIVFVVLLAATAARAASQNPEPPPVLPPAPPVMPSDGFMKKIEEDSQKRQQQFNDWVGCGREVFYALLIGGGAWGAMKGARAVQNRRLVARAEPQAPKAEPGPVAAQLPISSTAVTNQLDPSGFSVPLSPTENRDEVSLLTRQLVLSNQLDKEELIDHLGPPTETFKACPLVTIMCFVVSVAFIGLGTAAELALIRNMLSGGRNSIPLAEGLVISVPLLAIILGGAGLVVWAVRRFSFRLLVCPAGIIQVYRGNAVGAYWDQLRTVDLSENRDQHGRAAKTCIVHREDGFQFVFRTDYPKRVSKLIDIIVSHVA
jgi:hypothetical protein